MSKRQIYQISNFFRPWLDLMANVIILGSFLDLESPAEIRLLYGIFSWSRKRDLVGFSQKNLTGSVKSLFPGKKQA